jgi:hypothetical protein
VEAVKLSSDGIGRGGEVCVEAAAGLDDLTLIDTPFGVRPRLEGAAVRAEVGAPALPRRMVFVALPPLTCATKVEVRAAEDVVVGDKPILIAPRQPRRAGQEGKDRDGRPLPFPAPRFVPPDTDAYLREPERAVARLLETKHIGAVPVAAVELAPLTLDIDGLLHLWTRIEIAVRYEFVRDGEQTAQPTLVSRAQAERGAGLARLLVVNPEDVASKWGHLPWRLGTDYLVITDTITRDPNTLQSNGSVPGDIVGEFERLAAWKRRRGIRAGVVTISDILDGRYGSFYHGARDLQEIIRNFLKWAHQEWGVAWVLLGGDVSIVPVRIVAGGAEGGITVDTTDPPDKAKSYWTGSFLKVHAAEAGDWFPGSEPLQLVRPDTGELIPYDDTTTGSPSWYYCTDDTYSTVSATQTDFVRVNGPASTVNANVQFLYEWNTIPTDLYYADLAGANYSAPSDTDLRFSYFPGLRRRHDWDFNGNGIYGQHDWSNEFDGVDYQPDVSLGRAPVRDATEAATFVDKVLAYEQLSVGPRMHLIDWPARTVFVSSNWGGRSWAWSTGAASPGDDQYHSDGSRALIHWRDVHSSLSGKLFAFVDEDNLVELPYNTAASTPGHRGWYWAVSGTNLAASELIAQLPPYGLPFRIPIPTNWMVVRGNADDIGPQAFVWDEPEADGSMTDQEQLRVQMESDFRLVRTVARLYEDESDLDPGAVAAAPLAHIATDRVRAAFNAAPHFMTLSGHGNPDGCCDVSRSLADALTNGIPGFIGYADSCLTNAFDQDGMGSHLIRNSGGGAVAYIGSTRFSWIGLGDDFQRTFWHRLTTTRHLGLLADSRCALATSDGVYSKWATFSLNLLGDPEMPVWTGEVGLLSVIVNHERLPQYQLEVHVHGPGPDPGPIEEAVIHLALGEQVEVLARTGRDGIVLVDLEGLPDGQIELTVTAPGYAPHMSVVSSSVRKRGTEVTEESEAERLQSDLVSRTGEASRRAPA